MKPSGPRPSIFSFSLKGSLRYILMLSTRPSIVLYKNAYSTFHLRLHDMLFLRSIESARSHKILLKSSTTPPPPAYAQVFLQLNLTSYFLYSYYFPHGLTAITILRKNKKRDAVFRVIFTSTFVCLISNSEYLLSIYTTSLKENKRYQANRKLAVFVSWSVALNSILSLSPLLCQ